MKKEEAEKIEKLIGQLDGLYKEISILSRKAPNDAVNLFKINFINIIIKKANKFLPKEFKPFNDFEYFEEENIPTNSDVTFILTQYIEAVDSFRLNNILVRRGIWIYNLEDSEDEIRTSPPSSFTRKNNVR